MQRIVYDNGTLHKANTVGVGVFEMEPEPTFVHFIPYTGEGGTDAIGAPLLLIK